MAIAAVPFMLISKQPKKDNSADKTKTLTKSKIMAKMTNDDSVDERHQH